MSRQRTARNALLLLVLAGGCLPAWAADSGYAAKTTPLLERPAKQSRTLLELSKQQAVQIVGRQGSWAQVRAGTATGWARLADLRLSAAAAVAPVRAPVGKNDTGIRGFSEEELLVGAPNQAEGERLRAVGVSLRDAIGFARAANLRPRRQDYIQMQDYMPEGGFPDGFFDE